MRDRAFLAVTLLAAAAPPAFAHEAVPGVGGVAGALLHPFLVPQQLLCLVAITLIAGRAGIGRLALVALAFVAGLVLARAAAAGMPQIAAFWRAPLAAPALAGAALAAFPRLRAATVSLLGLCLGAGLSVDLVPETPGLGGLAAILAATAASALLLMAFAGAPLALAESRFGVLPLRIAGAWLLAISAMNLALSFRAA